MRLIIIENRRDLRMSAINILQEQIEENQDKVFAIFGIDEGRLSTEERTGEKADFLEIKVFTSDARLKGIAWYFGNKRAYIEDVKKMKTRKESQKVDMVLIAGEGTTAAGKKILKEAGIKLVKDLKSVKVTEKKKRRTKKKKKKVVETTIDDDISIATDASDLIKKAVSLANKREPEIVKVTPVNEKEGIFDVKGLSSTNDPLIIYRTIEKNTVGVKEIRSFVEDMEDIIKKVPVAILGRDKFTPSAKKEAQEHGINLVSFKDEKETEGSAEKQEYMERLAEGAIEIIEHRGYKILKESDAQYSSLVAGSEKLGTYIIAVKENEKGTSKMLILLPNEEVVRVATVRAFKDQMDALGVDEGMMIALKRFTYTAERECRTLNIIPIRKNHPVFNIFNHFLVPEHRVLSKKEVREVLKKYNCKMHQLPKIYEDDPGVVAIDARIGDVIEIERAPDVKFYRLVIGRPDIEKYQEQSALTN